jgi:hypothetical protein
MSLRHAIWIGAIAVAAALAASAPAEAAQGPATVSGKLGTGSAEVPRSARTGQAQVLAMNIDTRAFGDAAQVDRSGRYALELPPGKWALLSSVVALGRPFASFLSAGIVTRAGQRRTLPLTLKRFKRPRKKAGRKPRPKASAANINPRDGVAYAGEAYAIRNFAVVGGGSELAPLGKGMMQMLVADLLEKPRCPFTLVEWERRDVITDELALQQSEYVDPATRVEPGHLIDPEIFIRGRVEDRPGTPHRLALIAWLEDATTGARLSDDISSVTLNTEFFGSERRLAELLHRLICSRREPAPAVAPAPPAPSPPVPTPAPNIYSGSFSGEADSEAAFTHWKWSGTVYMDAANDTGASSLLPPPNGAPPGSYRTFSITSGSVDISVVMSPPGGCTFTGSERFDLLPGLNGGSLTVQLDVPNPAYALAIAGPFHYSVLIKGSGSNCAAPGRTTVFPQWATTGTLAHRSSSMTLTDAETVPDPEPSFHFTTRWSLAPG